MILHHTSNRFVDVYAGETFPAFYSTLTGYGTAYERYESLKALNPCHRPLEQSGQSAAGWVIPAAV